MTNGNSHDRLASSTENERMDMKLNSAQRNGRQRRCFPAEYEESRTKTNGEVSAADRCPKMQHSEHSETHQDCQEGVVKQKTVSEIDLNLSASLGKRRGGRKSCPVNSRTSFTCETLSFQGNGFSQALSNNNTNNNYYYSSPQGQRPIKRRLIGEDSALHTGVKKSKQCEQHGVVKNNSFENAPVTSKLEEGMECDKDIVNSIQETVPESGDTSDEELLKESFSPKKQESKFKVKSSQIQVWCFCWLPVKNKSRAKSKQVDFCPLSLSLCFLDDYMSSQECLLASI